MNRFLLTFISGLISCFSFSQTKNKTVTDYDMQSIYNETKTPYKYGLVMIPDDNSRKLDCPFIFRHEENWYMTYIVFDGTGYETWIAKSNNLLDWEKPGRILSFPEDTSRWDRSQKAGYPALQDYTWGGTGRLQKYDNKYWMSYLGGKNTGYEEGLLSIGMAFTENDPSKFHEWNCLENPVLTSEDGDSRWWENIKLYKSTVIRDRQKSTCHEFVMFYNAYGDSLSEGHNAERIGMAISDDMVHWKRFMRDPVLNHFRGITGDPLIRQIGKIWVMFYFGAFWNKDGSDGAFNRFACSYDLINWTDWKGVNLIEPSEPYDSKYAHKPFIVKWNGIVYHFYCAVNDKDQRGIAVSVSKDLGKSKLAFVR
ncbi:MAG: glycosylase [Bacteroidales bacterium]|nr:glycosylase [Bacteroidales bacterium]